MLHTKFRENRSAGSREEDFWAQVQYWGHNGNMADEQMLSTCNTEGGCLPHITNMINSR